MHPPQRNTQQVVHGEDLMGREIQVAVDMTLGDDVDGSDVRLDDFHGAGKVVFRGEFLQRTKGLLWMYKWVVAMLKWRFTRPLPLGSNLTDSQTH